MTTDSEFDKLADRLRQERDELRLQIHLGAREVQDEWRDLEKKWAPIEARLEALKDDVVDAGREAGANLEVVADEIAEAYRRIRKRLRS